MHQYIRIKSLWKCDDEDHKAMFSSWTLYMVLFLTRPLRIHKRLTENSELLLNWESLHLLFEILFFLSSPWGIYVWPALLLVPVSTTSFHSIHTLKFALYSRTSIWHMVMLWTFNLKILQKIYLNVYGVYRWLSVFLL